MVVPKNCEPELSFILVEFFNLCQDSSFQIPGRSYWWSLYLKMLGKSRHWIPNPGVSCSKPLGGSNVDSALHPSEVDQMSTRNFWELSGKK